MDTPPASAVVAAYYTSWGMYKKPPFTPLDIPTEHLTHVNYAFANVSENGTVAYSDKWADIECSHDPSAKGSMGLLNNPASPLRKRNTNMKSLISVGGWTFSKMFSLVARTVESRAKFAQSIVEFVNETNFDGVDIDWEYPVEGGLAGNNCDISDKENFGLLLNSLRKSLDELAKKNNRSHILLTVAVSASPSHIVNLDVPALALYCDWVNVMTYDACGSWSSEINHHASIVPFAQNAIDEFVRRGLPVQKIALGIPFYGRGFAGVEGGPDGQPPALGSKFQSVSSGTSEAGIVDYDDLRLNYTSQTGFSRTFDPEARTAVFWNNQSRIWISGESKETVTAKAKWARERGLAGVFFWELSMDREHQLLDAIHSALIT